MFPFTAPSKETIVHVRETVAWQNSDGTKSRKIDKSDKLLSKRKSIYMAHMAKFATVPQEFIDFSKDPDGQRADLERFLNMVFEEVTHKKDGAGNDLEVNKPYILGTMMAPDQEKISQMLAFINDIDHKAWVNVKPAEIAA